MALYQTNLPGITKPAKIVNQLQGLEGPWDGNTDAWLSERGVTSTQYDASLGTIGGGNHFAELQCVESVVDQKEFEALHLSENQLFLLVHSGSRGFGEAVLQAHNDAHGTSGLDQDTDDAINYLTKHEHACSWAKASRELIAHRAMKQLNATGEKILDVWHNNVVLKVLCSSLPSPPF